MATTPEFTIEDCRTINDACQARLRVLTPGCEAYVKYQRLASKANDMLVALSDAALDAELAAEGVDLDDEV